MSAVVNTSQGCQGQGKSDFIQEFCIRPGNSLIKVGENSGNFIFRLLVNTLLDIVA